MQRRVESQQRRDVADALVVGADVAQLQRPQRLVDGQAQHQILASFRVEPVVRQVQRGDRRRVAQPGSQHRRAPAGDGVAREIQRRHAAVLLEVVAQILQPRVVDLALAEAQHGQRRHRAKAPPERLRAARPQRVAGEV